MRKNILFISILIGGIILLNFLASQFRFAWDLTEDQRYTLSEPVDNLLDNMNEDVFIRVYMTADFLPADFKLFKKSITEKLEDFKSASSKLDFIFEDPNEGDPELVQSRGMALRRMGINPVRVGKDQQGKDVYVFPAAVFEGRDTVLVNLMENEVPGQDQQTVIANSISLLEYNFARGIKQASQMGAGVIAFTEGCGELTGGEVADLDRTLRMRGHAVGRLVKDEVLKVGIIDPQIDVLIVAKPRTAFSDDYKFLIDQYVMGGGNVIWLVDRMSADLDSMMQRGNYVPWDYPLELENLLFKYGFRIQPNLVMDMECTSVKLVDGTMGNAADMSVYPWYFHPAARPFSDNPIVKNLDRVNLRFASTIDTIRTPKAKTKKTILLRSSDKALLKYSPIDLNFEFLRKEANPVDFKERNLPLAILSEGEFVSAYANSASSSQLAMLQSRGMDLRKKSLPSKMLVVGDGDIAKNDYDSNTGKIRTLGFDRVSGYSFANKDFLMNAIEYMIDGGGIIEAKNREVKMNMLDCNRAKSEKSKWQFVNILMPLLFLAIFGAIYHYIRRRRFAK